MVQRAEMRWIDMEKTIQDEYDQAVQIGRKAFHYSVLHKMFEVGALRTFFIS